MQFLGHLVLLKMTLGVVVFFINLPVLSLTLQESFDRALKVDPALRASNLNQEASNENVAIAVSRLIPHVSFQGSLNNLTQTSSQDVPGSASISRGFGGPSVNHQIVIRQALIRSKDISGLTFSELMNQYGQVKYQADIAVFWKRVTYGRIAVVSSTQFVETYERPLMSLMAAANQDQINFLVGDGTKHAAVEAEAQYQNANATNQQALQNFKSKLSAFEMLTQISVYEMQGIRLDLNLTSKFTELDQNQLWKSTKEKSSELRFSELLVLLQKERVRMAKADHTPTLYLMVAWNIAKNDATSTQGYRYQNNQFGIQYMAPIYLGGADLAVERQSSLALQSSMAKAEVIANNVEGDFKALWAAWLSQIGRVKAGYKLVESTKEQLKAIELSHIHDVKTVIDVAAAELALSRKIDDQINVVVEYL